MATTSQFDPSKIQDYRNWAKGKNATQIASEASNLGFTAEQVKSVLGGDDDYSQYYTPGKGLLDASVANKIYSNDGVWTDPANQNTGAATTSATTTNIPTNQPTYAASTYTPPVQAQATQFNATTQSPATTYNASPASVSTVTQDQQLGTVEGRIAGLLGADSPLMQRASQRGLDLAESRGLLNSGMAIQNAQAAMMDYATPIASADAASFNAIQAANQAATNRNAEFNATQQQLTDAANTAAQNAVAAANAGYAQEAAKYRAAAQDAINQFNANASAQAGQFNASAQNAAAAQGAESATQTAMQILKGEQATALAGVEAQYKTQIQTSASAANFYSNVLQQWSASQQATGTTAEQKNAAATFYQQALRNGMAIISASNGGSSVDLLSLLNFADENVTGTPQASTGAQQAPEAPAPLTAEERTQRGMG